MLVIIIITMKIIHVICIVLVVCALAQPALALDVGVTPDSPFYPIKRILENLDLLLTFDEVSKVEKYLKYAKLRLIEAEKMAEEGKTEYVDDLLRDYQINLQSAVELIKSAKPSDASKITEMIVNASVEDLKILDLISQLLPNYTAIEVAKLNTVRQGEMAIVILKDISPDDAYRLSLSLTNKLLKIADEKVSKGENADYLIKESNRIMKESEEILQKTKKVGGLVNPEEIFEEIKSIIDEATNISIIENPEKRNVTTDIIEKGLKIYKKLGIQGVVQ